MDPRIAEVMSEIRAYQRAMGLTQHELAKRAGLGEVALRGFNTPDWNPSVGTLSRLHALMEGPASAVGQSV